VFLRVSIDATLKQREPHCLLVGDAKVHDATDRGGVTDRGAVDHVKRFVYHVDLLCLVG
jgi:hypothetical protein